MPDYPPNVLRALAMVRANPQDAVAVDMIEDVGFTVEQGAALYSLTPLPEVCPACKGECGFQANSTWVPCDVCDGDGSTPLDVSHVYKWALDYRQSDDSARPLFTGLAERDVRFGPAVAEEMRRWEVSAAYQGETGRGFYLVESGVVRGARLSESAARLELKRRVLACLRVACGKCEYGWQPQIDVWENAVRCDSCSGTGRVELRVPCPGCEGAGQMREMFEDQSFGEPYRCGKCSGRGTIGVSELIPEREA